jgi:hypothetical protein
MRPVLGIALFLVSSAGLAAEPKGVGYCAQFLPEGKQYSYQVEGTVDRRARGATLKYTVKVSGTKTFTAPATYKETKEENEKSAADFGKEIGPFQKCLTAVLEGK